MSPQELNILSTKSMYQVQTIFWSCAPYPNQSEQFHLHNNRILKETSDTLSLSNSADLKHSIRLVESQNKILLRPILNIGHVRKSSLYNCT